MLQILDTKKNSATKNMEIDKELLNNIKDQPILHFYDWEEKSLTYGYFIDIKKFINLKKASSLDLNMAKRPTGGGIVFHIWDFAFSFLMPKNHKYFFLDPLKNYEFVNSIVLESLKDFLTERLTNNQSNSSNKKSSESSNKLKLLSIEKKNKNFSLANFCMAKPTKYDVVYKGKKIAGASQRRKKNGYLHQTSICLIKPDFDYLKKILIDEDVAEEIGKSSFPIFFDGEIDQRRKIIKEKLIEIFTKKIF